MPRETRSQVPGASHRPLPPHLSASAGLLMGGADAIPGVSGGTIALILGIYERFVDALHVAIRTPLLVRSADGRTRLRRAYGFLVPLGIGVLLAYYLATRLLVGPSDDKGIMRQAATAPACYAFFFGLVLVSLREPWRRIQERSAGSYAAAALACAGAALFVGLPHRGGGEALWPLVFGGAGAIAVMLLPGVSGSLLLVIVGQYTTVAEAVHDRELSVLLVFFAGVGLGVLTFIPLLRFLLARRHDLTMAALTGLMAGSLRALWPWKSSYEPKEEMRNVGVGDGLPWVLLALVAGAAVVWLLGRLERRLTSS